MSDVRGGVGMLVERFFGSKDSLRRKAVFGSQWLSFKSTAQGICDLVKTAVFARILFPDDYGLMALAMMAIGLLESFSTLGLEIIVQRDDDDFQTRLPAYWTIRFIRGLVLTALAWIIAVPFAEYYQRPELKSLVRFLALAFLFKGSAGFGAEIRQRRMEFGQIALVDSAASLSVLILGLAILYWLRSIWALAAYIVITAAAMMVTSYILFPWRPSIRLDKSVIKTVAIFSGSIIVINILNYFFNNFDKGTIGKLLGVEQLGYYARAYFLALLPVSYFSNIFAPVILNAFRTISKDPHRFRKSFLKTSFVAAATSITVGVLFFIFSKHIILIIYGKKWLPLLPLFQILLIFGVSKGIVTVCPSVFFIKEKPWIISATTAIMVGCFAILCIPMTNSFNAIGTAWAVVISAILSHGLSFIFALRVLSTRTIRSIQYSGEIGV
jgi:O-antigen/teichoic acid export membrane protein